MELFVKVMLHLVTSRQTRGQLIKAVKDICCKILVDHWERLSHRGFADMCKVVSHLQLEAQSAELEHVVSAVEKYLHQEIDAIEAGLMYSIARSIQVGNRTYPALISGGKRLVVAGKQ